MRSASTSTSRPSSRIFSKFLALAGIVILLLIALGMTSGVLRERRETRTQAVREIEQSWGGRQTLIGPVLRVPVERTREKEVRRMVGQRPMVVREQEVEHAAVWIMPEQFSANLETDSETRYRGIYETSVYSALGAVETDFAFDPSVLNAK